MGTGKTSLAFTRALSALLVAVGNCLDIVVFFFLNIKEVKYLRKQLANLLHSGLISLECLSENSLSR